MSKWANTFQNDPKTTRKDQGACPGFFKNGTWIVCPEFGYGKNYEISDPPFTTCSNEEVQLIPCALNMIPLLVLWECFFKPGKLQVRRKLSSSVTTNYVNLGIIMWCMHDAGHWSSLREQYWLLKGHLHKSERVQKQPCMHHPCTMFFIYIRRPFLHTVISRVIYEVLTY